MGLSPSNHVCLSGAETTAKCCHCWSPTHRSRYFGDVCILALAICTCILFARMVLTEHGTIVFLCTCLCTPVCVHARARAHTHTDREKMRELIHAADVLIRAAGRLHEVI